MNASGPGSNVRIPRPLIESSQPHSCPPQSTLAVIRSSLKNEGAMFMFKGWLPAWTRLQPTTILIFLTLEQLRNGVDFTRARGYTML